MYEFAKSLNDAGSTYPLWAVGSGFLQMMMFEHTDAGLVSSVDAENLVANLEQVASSLGDT